MEKPERPIATEDLRLRQLLREHSHRPGDNPWFTRRVLNRLPEPGRRVNPVPVLVYLVALIICLVCWRGLVREQDFLVITLRDVTHFAALTIVTVIVLWQALALMLSHTRD